MSHAFVEIPSASDAFSTAVLRDSGRRRLIRADSSSPTEPALSPGASTKTSSGSCPPRRTSMWPDGANLEVAGRELGVQLERRLGEEVEELQPQVRAEGLAEPPRDQRRALV